MANDDLSPFLVDRERAANLVKALPVKMPMLPIVLKCIVGERLKQQVKWGEQTHASFHPDLMAQLGDLQIPHSAFPSHLAAKLMAEFYCIPHPTAARSITKGSASEGKCNWMSILLEEVTELCEAKTGKDLYIELIQIAAVATQWAERLLATSDDVLISLADGPWTIEENAKLLTQIEWDAKPLEEIDWGKK